ncbi:unnamed protein product [Rotaria sp. Silwood1]|nr:unnamed protein product [Rotaria sp. Silwood1]
MDLECLTMFEIDVSNERDSLEEDPDDELEFKRLYDEALKKNLKLKQELKTLKEYHLMNSSWVCEFCTTLNESYIKTSCDIIMSSSHDDITNLNSDNILIQNASNMAQIDDKKNMNNTQDNIIQSNDSDLQHEIPMNLLPAGNLRNFQFSNIR